MDTFGIIGGGIGGLTAAIALARAGAKTVLAEEAPVFGEVGAGLQLGPNAMAVLAKLGLADKVLDVATRPEAVALFDGRTGRALTRFTLGDAFAARMGHPFVNIHRADLIAVLERAARKEGVSLRLGSRAVVPNDRPGIVLASGEHVPVDAVVAADGMRSPIRAALFDGQAPVFSGHIAWRMLVARPESWPAEVRVWLAPGRHVVAYPLRTGLLNIVAVEGSAATAPESWRESGDPARLRARFGDFAAPVVGLLERVAEVFVWGLYGHPPLAGFVRSRVALLGDAAHPMLPYLAQGAGMAIEDGWVLSRMVAERGIDAGLVAYGKARSARVARVQAASRANGRLYHASGAMRAIRNAGFGLLGMLAPGAVQHRFDWLYGEDVTRQC